MADSTPAAAVAAAHLPSPADIARAEQFTRERFVHEGEDPSVALGAGTPRRQALDAALAELGQGIDHPSTAWRRAFSLLLGLERVLSEDEPHLVDGTLLNPHQVDALSGTLTALLTGVMTGDVNAAVASNGNGNGASAAAVAVVAPPKAKAAPVAAPAEASDDDEDFDPDDPFDGSSAVPGEEEIDEELPDDEEPQDWEEPAHGDDEAQLAEQPEDPNAHKRFWFEHATGAGKTVAALGFVEASRTGGVLILTHRRNLVDQFIGELKDRGYRDRIHGPLMQGDRDPANGPVTVETYQWFVRNAGKISSAYTVVICDEAHTALGEKTSEAIREWTGPIFVGMTATGALIARHVTDLFPTQTSRFDLAQAARRGVISPLRGIRIPPGAGVRSIAKVPLRRGEVDVEFDQEMLAELLDQLPFNLAIANLYKTRFNNVPGVVYAAGVRHAYNVASAFRDEGLKAMAVSGETPKRELADILARYERGDIDVLVNAQLLAEGWNSPRATVCMHLAPTASKRIYQQRVGRVTRRNPGKESGVVVDFVHPATKHDDPVVTLHSLLDRDVYRGGAIVVGPVRRGRGRRVRVERRVLPVTADPDRRAEVFERELWRIAVEHLDWGEQHVWAALAGARVQPSGWRRARAMLHFDKSGELKRRFLLTAVQRNKSPQLRVRALQEIAAAKDAEAFDLALDEIGGWAREERREAVKVGLQALAEKPIGRRDQANAWIWRMAEYTREVHEEYAVQRWPETKRLLGLLVNSSGGAHARNARRLVQATRKQDRRLSAALLAAALAHTPEAEEVLRGARTRMARKPNSLARDLLRNFPKKRSGRGSRRKKRKGEEGIMEPIEALETTLLDGPDDDFEDGLDAYSSDLEGISAGDDPYADEPTPRSSRSSRSSRSRKARAAAATADDGAGDAGAVGAAAGGRAAVASGDGPASGNGASAGGRAASASAVAGGDAAGPAGAGAAPEIDEQDAVEQIGAAAALLPGGGRGGRRGNRGRGRGRGRSNLPPAAPLLDPDGESFGDAQPAEAVAAESSAAATATDASAPAATGPDAAAPGTGAPDAETPKPVRARRSRAKQPLEPVAPEVAAVEAVAAEAAVEADPPAPVKPARRSRAKAAAVVPEPDAVEAPEAVVEVEPAAPAKPVRKSRAKAAAPVVEAAEAPAPVVAPAVAAAAEAPAKPVRRSRAKAAVAPAADAAVAAAVEAPVKPVRKSRAKAAVAVADAAAEAPAKPVRKSRAKAATTNGAVADVAVDEAPAKPVRRTRAKATPKAADGE